MRVLEVQDDSDGALRAAAFAQTKSGSAYTSQPVLGQACAYDPVTGRKTSATTMEPDGSGGWQAAYTEAYGYDVKTGFLTSAQYSDDSSWNGSWAYDASGNRTGAGWDYDRLNRMTASPGSAYQHDAVGNRLWKDYSQPAQVRRYDWDDAGRLRACRGTVVGAAYSYRADGMRVRKVENVLVSAVLDDNEQVSGYHDVFPMNKPTTRFYHDGQAGMEEDHTVEGQPGQSAQLTVTRHALGARGGDARYVSVNGAEETSAYPLYDGHGNMVGEVARAGSSPWFTLGSQRKYDAWGQVRSGSGPDQGYCANLQHRRDAESGLVYMRARYYEPWTGRFISEDPAMDGPNWYVYCGNDPGNKTDPAGTSAITAAVGFLYFFFWLANTPSPSIIDVESAFGRAMKIATFDPTDFLNLTETENAIAFGLDVAAMYAPSIFSIIRCILTGRPPVGGAIAGVIMSGIVIGAELGFLVALYALRLEWYIDMAMES
ncbi:MAG: RHS repeat-associated core domain-containing protein [Fimbriimonadaceae bacterium]|nr:RHS repeat-associated core domain-containing protein [Fimbriimonadaceae bacterium]QYK58956.1 MAG: RHS repeat-associated core domain-containing protein [Fimbriimonadaceae bacterium]